MAGLGFEVLPSGANFVFATHPSHTAEKLFSQLRERGIVVRHFAKPRIENYLRISIGSEEANNTLLTVLQELLA